MTFSIESTFSATTFPTPTQGFSISSLTQRASSETPGNVGICMCGGGSRAMSAGMGQLRALQYLKTANGKSLLEQTKAISTVSGGSWLGVPFTYLQNCTTNNYLNTYVSDPNQLVPSQTQGASLAETLDQLPQGNVGQNIGSSFSVTDIALKALALWLFHDTPASMLWQTVIGIHFLKPYGLYTAGDDQKPTSYFSFNDSTVAQLETLPQQNHNLSEIIGHTVADEERPFLICNTAMFVQQSVSSSSDFEYLAPVQCTPFFTGIVGTPTGVDANGKNVGSGGVDSFAFNSNLPQVNLAGDSQLVQISNQRAFSLLDIVGTSSAAFAEQVFNLFSDWKEDFSAMCHAIYHADESIWNELKSVTEHDLEDLYHHLLWAKNATQNSHDFTSELKGTVADLRAMHVRLSSSPLDAIVPQYQYWPIAPSMLPQPAVKPTRFADGGSLENTGVAAMLTYSDIKSVISFVNSITPLSCDSSVEPPETDPDQTLATTIEVDSQLPPLFGYQAFDHGQYKLYAGDSNPTNPQFKNSQIFASNEFGKLLYGLARASKGGQNAASFQQTLSILPNAWFGVKRSDTVTVLWVYMNSVQSWYDKLSPDVQDLVSNTPHFPHYQTIQQTELTATEVNLLSNLTAWSLVNTPGVLDLYQD
ncbi:hypothetical protein [Echinimonas agarilytica]|uniref:PLA2c domain-containing protein n=1 Tax=Echinimonas agarilytica TaxID=1215918 RepID=A0AA42B7J1_9GAMM|nr:hypothetical protein [Echinimonas agarilytica]MCM2679403.1 hypothetical protein [Echinimonas agarilytica]